MLLPKDWWKGEQGTGRSDGGSGAASAVAASFCGFALVRFFLLIVV